MTPEPRKSRSLVFVVAGGFLVVGFLDILAYWFKSRHDQTPMSPWRCVYLSIPLVIGVALLVKSSALARLVDQYLDDE